MKSMSVRISKEFDFEYDEDSAEFKSALISYTSMIADDGIQGMMQHVAYTLGHLGMTEVEGVGMIGTQHTKGNCGITVADDDPQNEYE